jgi:hypothetical protein
MVTGLLSQLCNTKTLLFANGMLGLLEPLDAMCKSLQAGDSGIPAVAPIVRRSLLVGQFIENSVLASADTPDSSCGHHLLHKCAMMAFVPGACTSGVLARGR